MLARRDFLYKRSHQNLAARASSPAVSLPGSVDGAGDSATPAISATPSANPATSDPVNPPTAGPGPKTSDTPSSSPTPPAASATSSASARASSSAPAPSSLSSASSSLSSGSASATPTSSSLVSTPLTAAAATTVHTSAVFSSQVAPGITYNPTSSVSPATTSSASSSGGTSTGTIVGAVAGVIAGIAILGFLLTWCMRRQRNRDVDDFDAQAFKRQSAILVDDPVEPPRSYNPRPPTMIERHNASPALAAQAGIGGQNFYGNYGGYGQQAAYAPEPVGSPPPQAYGAPQGYTGYNDATYDSQPQLARQPSNAQYLTRQPSATGYAPPTAPPGAFDPNAHYIDLNRSSVSPYQAAQYADISRQLGTANPNGQAPRQSLHIPDAPLPSPFDEPAEVTNVAVPHSHPSSAATPVPQMQGHTSESRPATIYEEGDAYGGI